MKSFRATELCLLLVHIFNSWVCIIGKTVSNNITVNVIGIQPIVSRVNAIKLSMKYCQVSFSLQISCISASPLLANREVYHHYFQIIPSKLGQVIGFYNIITHYGWTRVGIIVEDEDLFTEVGECCDP